MGVSRLFVAFVMMLWLGGSAAGATLADAIAGRWQSTREGLPSVMVLDISRCGDGWCGIMVTEAGRCESTVLHLDAKLTGRLELDPRANWFGVGAFLDRGGNSLRLEGQSGREFFIGARTFGYSRQFARSGVASCAPNPVS